MSKPVIRFEEAIIEIMVPVKDNTGVTSGFTTAKVNGLRGTFDPPIELKNGETISFETPLIILKV